MEHDISIESVATPDTSSKSSTDLEVIRHQLLHVRQKYEALLLGKRRRIAKALFRVRSINQRRRVELQGKLLECLLVQITPALDKRINELAENYLKNFQECLKETFLTLYEEEESHLIQKAVERLYSVVAKTNPRGSYRILLNSADYARIAEKSLPEITLDHKHEIKKGTAVLISPMGEVSFDWLTPLQSTLRLREDLKGY